jgi:membrane-associated phospholipid phosphatase
MIPAAQRRALIGILFALGATTLEAQSDTITPPRHLFTWRDGLLAGMFVGATYAIEPLDKAVAERLQRPYNQQNTLLQRAATGFRVVALPGTVVIGTSMYLAGRIARSHRTADLGLHGTEALLVGELLAAGGKGVFGRQRPYVGDTLDPTKLRFLGGFTSNDAQRSFPSGHATAAFAAASAVTSEARRWWPHEQWVVATVMYGGATLVGLSRMYNNAHWASDVALGAGIGTFSGIKVVRYSHAHPDNFIDRALLHVAITPSGPHETRVAWTTEW